MCSATLNLRVAHSGLTSTAALPPRLRRLRHTWRRSAEADLEPRAAELRSLEVVADSSTASGPSSIFDAALKILGSIGDITGGVLEDSGGGIGPEDDPDLSPGIGAAAQELERQLRTAHELLEQTGG
jgi:hypothetical protein